MKRIALLALTIMILFACALAEDFRADLAALLDTSEIPATTTVRYDLQLPAGAQVETRRHGVELQSSKGDVLNVEVTMKLVNLPLSEDQFAQVADWLKGLVTQSVQAIGADSESLANVVAAAISDARSAAQASQDSALWANRNLMIESVSATVPYYPTLQKGSSGAATQRLQRRLIQLGFLNDTADGHYGSNTEEAVKALEQYVRKIEQGLIDERPRTAQPTLSTPEPTPTPAPYMIPLSIQVAETPLPSPTAIPEPTPATAVDGIADPLLQAYLYSDHFKITLGELSATASGDQVMRVQRRLGNLGYLSGVPDGYMGSDTARSLRVFQHYNHLTETGRADEQTLQMLFSEGAEKPPEPLLTEGMTGEAVSALQKRLRVLGFAAIAVDGNYGASTKAGVETLQKYMLQLTGGAQEGGYVVNGVADPLLLEAFYSDSFPAIPATLDSTSSGSDVVRLQRRLQMLNYYTGALDGNYGSGTEKAVQWFQRIHHLTQSGRADRQTLEKLFDENAQKSKKPYILIVSLEDQRVYAYGLDENNDYADLARTMVCSSGRDSTPTPVGTYTDTTGPGARWHYFKKFDCWAQYAYYIQGDIMFHSVLYGEKEGSATSSSVRNLGNQASHGCVRLSVEDAKWIWENCPKGTTVIVR